MHGYERVDKQRGVYTLVGYNHFLSKKREWIIISIIAQVIIEICALSLVENYVISRYNYPAQGDYRFHP